MSKPNRTKNNVNFYVNILIILGFICVINFLSTKFFQRLDLTHDKEFTVSKATKKTLKELNDVVNITVFITQKKLPPQFLDIHRRVKDLLSEYRAYGKGKLLVQFRDPDEDEKVKADARSLGIPEVQATVFEKDQTQQIKVFLGLVVEYADKKEAIPVLQNPNTLEYDITSRIKKVTRKEQKKVVYFFGSHEGRHDATKDYQGITKVLDEQYECRSDFLKNGEGFEAGTNTAIISGVKEMTERQKFEVDQFLMNGGKLIILADAVEVKAEYGMQASPVQLNYLDLLSTWGLEVNQDLVLDAASNYPAAFNSGFMTFQIPYAFWPKILKPGFDNQIPAVSGLEAMGFAWASSVGFHSPVNDSGSSLKGVRMVRTSRYSTVQKGQFNLDPNQKLPINRDMDNPQTLAVVVSGTFPSHYAGKSVPGYEADSTGKDGKPIKVQKLLPSDATRQVLAKSKEPTQIILVGNSSFVADQGLRQFGGSNAEFFINCVDWLTLDNDLISIRSRTAIERPLKIMEPATKNLIKYGNILFSPILVALFGIGLVIYRKKREIKL